MQAHVRIFFTIYILNLYINIFKCRLEIEFVFKCLGSNTAEFV